jgi:hypothetical protein
LALGEDRNTTLTATATSTMSQFPTPSAVMSAEPARKPNEPMVRITATS